MLKKLKKFWATHSGAQIDEAARRVLSGEIEGRPGSPGQNGREIELGVDTMYIKWRYVGNQAWTNLIPKSDLKGEPGKDGEDGEDGRTPMFRVYEGMLQSRYSTEDGWTNLFYFGEAKPGQRPPGGADVFDDQGGFNANMKLMLSEFFGRKLAELLDGYELFAVLPSEPSE